MPRHNLAIVDAVPQGSSRIASLAAKYKAINEEKKALDARLDAIRAKLLTAVQAEGTADDEGKVRLETDAYKLVIVKGQGADQISATKLVDLGVRLSVIKKATVKGKAFEYVRVDEKKGQTALQEKE